MPQKYSTRRAKPSPGLSALGKKKITPVREGAIPIVDISALLERSDTKAMQRALCRMRRAARETGLFYLSGHGIPVPLLRKVYASSLQDLEFKPEFKITLSTKEGVNRYIADRRGIFAGTRIDMAPEGGATVLEKYYDHIFDLCRSLLHGCAMALNAPADLFHCLLANPVLHGRLLHYPPSDRIRDSGVESMNQPYGTVTIPWTRGVDGIHLAGAGADTRLLPAGGRFSFRLADAMARLSTDLHISVPHRFIDGPGHETFLIPVFYGSENNIPSEWATSCFLTEQPEQLSPPV